IDLSLSAAGLTVQTQSLLSILIGGIAFETPPTGAVLSVAEANTVFTLFGSRTEAFNPPPRDPQTYRLVFNQSVPRLVARPPVEFRGIRLGEVVDVGAQVDVQTATFSAPVTVRLDPERLGVDIRDLAPGADLATVRRKVIDSLVAHGARGQLRSGSLLTGSLYV